MLAPVAPDAALPVLLEASKDPNPVVRADVMRVFEKTGLLAKTQQASAGAPGGEDKATSLEALRRMLRDPDASTRLHAAGSILSMSGGIR
jgi:HEAT repeat protein